MADLDDQLRRLADHRAERVPPVRAAEVAGGGSGPGRTPVWWLAAAAVLAALVGGAAWLIDSTDDTGADVAGDPTTTAVPSTTVPSTVLPSMPGMGPSTPVDPTGTGPLVTATDEGIELFEDGTTELVPVGPTHLAFLAGDVLVHQAADAEGFGWGDGPVLAGFVGESSGEVHLGADVGTGDLVTLLDAALVDGRPTALVSRRTGATPETTDVRLLLVDLPGGDVTDLGRFGGWESGVADARFADGAIVLLRSAEAQIWVEVIDYDGTTLWELEPWFDGPPTEIAVVDGTVWTIDPGWSDDLRTPVFTWDRYTLLTGEPLVGGTVALTPVEGFDLPDGWCRRPFPLLDIGCGSADGAVHVDLENRLVEPIVGAGSGLVTTPTAVSRTAVSTGLFASFTTDEMEEHLRNTHVHLGGSMVSDEAGVAIELWGLGGGSAQEWLVEAGPAEVWLLERVDRLPAGTPLWARRAVIDVDLQPDETITPYCRIDGTPTGDVIGQVPQDPTGNEQWLEAAPAWRVGLDTLTLTEIDGLVECENGAFGL